MGKLNIAHHKSYHPYRLDNIERVKRDEEEAKRKEEGEEGRMRLADSEARLELLRQRAGISKRVKKKKSDDDIPESQPPIELSSISTSSGHINLFADIEQQAMSTALVRSRELAKKAGKPEEEKGFALAPSKKDLNPWYSGTKAGGDDLSDEKRLKDLSWKAASDPLTSIKSRLSQSYPPTETPFSLRRTQVPLDASEARVQRESSERARAMELIRRRRREKEREALGLGNLTPSSIGGDDSHMSTGYGDVYNRKETEEAHRRWDRGSRRDRGLGNFRDRRRELRYADEADPRIRNW